MASSYSSSSIPNGVHDVFLSFHGEDTRKTFVDCLYMFLIDKGFRTFKDDKELERGKSISPELVKSINDSRIAIIVFSENYASSSWCLDELVEILECCRSNRQIVLPLFFDVQPFDVENQTGKFGEAFTRAHEGIRTADEVKKWRKALKEATEISGLVLENAANGRWGVFIQQIVQDISEKLQHRSFTIAEHKVGINSRVEKLIMSMNDRSKDKLFIGICGIGGIGKTTVAKAVFNLIYNQFDKSCFLENVREKSTEKNGIPEVQQELLLQTLNSNVRILSSDLGMKEIEMRLRHKKILLILDDVDDEGQLLNLAGIGHNWFGSGSRIIITTRNKGLLTKYDVNICEAGLLDDNEALELFSWHAFKQKCPIPEFWDLSHRIKKYAQGLPLALRVLGSHLCGRSKQHWVSELGELDELESHPRQQIRNVLKRSYDDLDDIKKSIFLDIACFFKEYDKSFAMDCFASSKYQSVLGIEILIERSLITISEHNKLMMHDLIQEMGREIVRQESKNPGERSRLWTYKDIKQVFCNNTVTAHIEGIVLPKFGMEEWLIVSPDAFLKMNKLRILVISNVQRLGLLAYLSPSLSLPNQLKFIEWKNYLGKWLHLPKNLVQLRLSQSCIKQIQLDKKFHEKLKVIDISYCNNLTKTLNFYGLPCLEELHLRACRSVVDVEFHNIMKNLKLIELQNCSNLKKTPNFSQLPCLKNLNLKFCTSLLEVHPSIEFHQRLVVLNFNLCSNLTSLPTRINLKSLERLDLRCCSKLEKLPNIQGDMKCLKELDLSGTAIKELPSSFKHLKGLTRLLLENCKMLKSLPNILGEMKSLEKLELRGCVIKDLPPSVEYLRRLKILNLKECEMLESLPSNIGEMKSLEKLQLSGTAIKELPPSVEHLKRLKTLNLRRCEMLESLPSNIGEMKSLGELDLSGTAIEDLPASFAQLANLEKLEFNNCNLDDESILNLPHSLRVLNLSGIRFASLPASFTQLTKLESLALDDCFFLETLDSFPSSIRKVSAQGCISLQRYCIPTSSEGSSSPFDCPKWIFTGNRKLVENHGNKPNIYSQSEVEEFGNMSIFLPGSEIPSWFTHTHICESTDEHPSMCLRVDPNTCSNIKGIAVCAIVRFCHDDYDDGDWFWSVDFNINDHGLFFTAKSKRTVWSKDHILLIHMTHKPKDPNVPVGEWICNSDACYIEASATSTSHEYCSDMIVKKLGIHLVMDESECTEIYT